MATLSKISWGEAATIGLFGVGADDMEAWHILQRTGASEAPVEKGPFVLVYDDSSANVTLAIQLLKLSDDRVVTTYSPGDFKLGEPLRAEKALDCISPNYAQGIRNCTSDKFKFAMNTIAKARTC